MKLVTIVSPQANMVSHNTYVLPFYNCTYVLTVIIHNYVDYKVLFNVLEGE